MRRERGLLLPLILTTILAACGPAADGAITAQPPEVAIDSATLMRDIGVLAHDSMEGRGAGTPGSARARAFIERELARRGVEPLNGSYLHPFTFNRRGDSAETEGVNVIGIVRGTTSPDRYIVISAHYDHLGVRNGEIYNGADDNASGTAALLALARSFAEHPARHSLIFAAFDAEEHGLRGARAFVADLPVPQDAITLNVNMDMVGRNDAGELYVAGTYHYPDLLPLVERIAAEAEVTLIPGHDRPDSAPGDDWSLASDHGAFHEIGIPFLYFGVEDHPDYHKPTDDVEGIQPGFYARAVRTIAGAVRIVDAELP